MNKIAFVFPGQASQFVGMANDLYATRTVVKDLYSEANDILGFDLAKISFQGPEERLRETDVTQPAVFVHSVAVLRILAEAGVSPAIVAGHSLGEYSALVAAEALKFEEALQLVRERSRSMLQAGRSKAGIMAAVIGLDASEVNRFCENSSDKGVVVTANYNAPGQTVISGEVEAVLHVSELCKEAGAKRVVELSVSGAFHSPLMATAADRMKSLILKADMRRPRIPVITNVSGTEIEDPNILSRDLITQITHPVRWTQSMGTLVSLNIDLVVEVGPGQVIRGLMRRIARDTKFTCAGTEEEIATLVASVKEEKNEFSR